MSRKTWIGIAAALGVVLVVLLVWFLWRPSDQRTEEMRVGVILPLTGPVAEPGKQALNGLKLAIDQYNAQAGGKKIRLIVEDSQSDPKTGVSAAKKLISVDGVKIIIGDIMSSVAMAIAPIAEQNRVILFAPGASNPKFPDMGAYIFRNWASDDYDGKVMADYLLRENKLQRGAVVYVNNDYGLGLAQAFRKRYEALGGSVSIFEGYDQGATDFRPVVAKIKSVMDLQFVYLPGQPVENGHLVKQLREAGVRLDLAANLSVESREFTTIVGAKGVGIIFTSPAFDPEALGGSPESFRAAYERIHGSPPDVTAGHGFDAGNILIQALMNCDFSVSRLRDSLAAIRDFPGVTGKTTFTDNGDVRKDVLLKKIESGGNAVVLARFSTE